MNADQDKLKQVEELRLCGADPAVVRDFILDLEKTFLREALAYEEQQQHDRAICKYLFAMLLPDRTSRHEEFMRHALFSLDHLVRTSGGIDQISCLDDALFSNLKKEMDERWAQKNNRSLIEQFRRLDAEPSLSKKDVDNLEVLRKQLSQSDSIANEWLVAEVRLSQEKQAKELFKNIIEKVTHHVAVESDHSKRQEIMYGEIRELTARAVEYASGARPVYGQQIMDYVTDMEKLFIRSDTERIVATMDLEVNRQREVQRDEFNKIFSNNSDEACIIETICKTLRVFRNHDLYEDLKKVSFNWITRDCRFRFEAISIEDPARARSLMNDSLRHINQYEEALPEEIRTEFKRFLESLAARLAPEEEPHVMKEPELPTQNGNRVAKWLKRLFRLKG